MSLLWDLFQLFSESIKTDYFLHQKLRENLFGIKWCLRIIL